MEKAQKHNNRKTKTDTGALVTGAIAGTALLALAICNSDSVAFYADGSLFGSDDEAPYQWYWDTGTFADDYGGTTRTTSTPTGATNTDAAGWSMGAYEKD